MAVNAVMYFLIILSVILFFQGFFPVSHPNLNIDNEPPSEIQNIHLNKNYLYGSNITKTVLIVVDALRLDFATPNYMPLTSQLALESGCFNKIKVETPTVTLPRIKALTAGNIPQFIDLVLNLASTEILSDSIIHSAVRDKKKVIFYGDETWLKLFPNKFLRFEGTNSFFVRDFEVDKNVTRNVHVELNNDDWDIMILHYLDLDHIGHVYGPFSSLIPRKLDEIDKRIYNSYKTISLKYQNALFLVTGDHGMKDSGGHGGSTYSETNVPLLILGLKCKNNSFPQTDIPVNLAVLLGLRIPSISIGRVQKSMIPYSLEKYLYILYYNSFLLSQRHSCNNSLMEANGYYIDYLRNSNESSAYKAVELYENCLKEMTNILSKSSIKQNFHYLLISSMVMLNCLITLCLELKSNESKAVIFKYVMVLFVAVQYMVGQVLISFLTTIVLLPVLLKNIYALIKSLDLSIFSNILNYFVFGCVVHPLTFLSSSYVEEEHLFWYFLNISILFFLLSKTKKAVEMFFYIMFLVSFRLIRIMNSTGDKWANYPDLSDWFLQNENIVYYQLFFISSLILVFLTHCYLTRFKNPFQVFLYFFILILIFVFKQNETSTLLAKFIWLLIFVNFISTTFSNISTWILVLSLLLKPFNLILIPYCIFSSLHFSKYFKKTELLVLYHTFLSNMLFFAQGHSNSLASVDISVGYIGLTSYQPVLVIGQVLCHTQAFPVLCHLLIFHHGITDGVKVWKILFSYRLYIFIIISIITFLFRHHLFIWSVFAPKLFIEFVQMLFLYLEYCLYQIQKLVQILSKDLQKYVLHKILFNKDLGIQCLVSKINDT